MTTVADVARFIESVAPLERAADWDNVGLLLGSQTNPVARVLVCLTTTPEVVAEAVAWQADLIVTHHPILFRPVQRLTDGTPEGRMVLALARANIAVYSSHTAFDDCAGGINDLLAGMLQLADVEPLRPNAGVRNCKLVVFVPDQDLSRVSDALFHAGAGIIGTYSQCSFRLAGTGTFFGGADSNPTIGVKGQREEVTEWRLEAVCAEAAVNEVVAAMRAVHSYEEPAYDVYPLLPQRAPMGVGRVGKLPQPVTLAEFAGDVRTKLGAGPVQVVGALESKVQCVAIACGAGGTMLTDAIHASADVFLTGEARFHDYLAARAQQLALVMPGHFWTEQHGAASLAKRIQDMCTDLHVQIAESECDPVNWV